VLKAELQSGRLSLSPIGFASQQVMDTLQLLATSPSKKHVDLMQEDDPMYIPACFKLLHSSSSALQLPVYECSRHRACTGQERDTPSQQSSRSTTPKNIFGVNIRLQPE